MSNSAIRKRAYRIVGWCALVVLALAANANSSFATPLPVNNAVLAAIEGDPSVGGLLVGTTGVVPFAAATYTGTLTSQVYRDDPNNPYIAGVPDALTFVYTIHNDASSVHELHRFTVSSFETFLTDVGYSILAAGREPYFIDRNGGLGDVVGFNFPPTSIIFPASPGAILPGLTTRRLIVRTDAILFQPTLASVIDGTTTEVESLAPRTLVPEPSSIVLSVIGLGFVLIAAIRRRRG